MLTSPLYALGALLAIEGLILYLSDHPRFAFLFKYLPSMFWIYFLPMLANTLGLLGPASAEKARLYSSISNFCLPASLVLLLLSVDVIAIAKLGRTALLVMAFGIAGVMAGACAVTCLYGGMLGPEAYKAIGALSASWIGGSANMIAVKEAVNTPDSVFLPAVVVDTIVPYTWMGLLIALSAWQTRIDKFNRAELKVIDDLSARAASQIGPAGVLLKTRSLGKFTVLAGTCILVSVLIGRQFNSSLASPAMYGLFALITTGAVFSSSHDRASWTKILSSVFIAVAGAFACVITAGHLPVIKDLVNTTAWIIILATFLGIAISFTPARKLESAGCSKLGFAVLYLVLASIGAKAQFSNLSSAPLFLLAGFTWIAIHGVFLIIAARIFRSPVSLVAAASQASIGGPASAPVVAGIYQPQLAPVGLLLAVFGNIIGTFLGLATTQLCGFLSAHLF